VLRPLALVLAFMFAGGPEMSLLCKSWCASRDPVTATCHHRDDQTTRIADNRTCAEGSLDTANFVKNDVRRVPGSSPESVRVSPALAVDSARSQLLTSSLRQPAVHEYPIFLALRI
jgi:hypothetical protein